MADVISQVNGLWDLVNQGNASTSSTTPLQDNYINSSKNGFIHQIRDQLYYIEIWLYNQISGQKKFSVPFYFINSLAIEETIFDFNVRGWIVFNTDFEILERGSTSITTPKGTTISGTKPSFIFITDGRNKISIKIYPIPNNQKGYTISTNTEELPKEKLEMNFDCVIYDVEDLPTKSAQKKMRKFYFWDERYQHFLEKNVEWSTSVQGLKTYDQNYQSYDKIWKLKDYQRSIPASYAIRSLIETASLKDPATSESGSGGNIKIGYADGGTIDLPDVPLNTFSIDWDWGYEKDYITNAQGNSYRKDLVFYTSPANNNVMDDLNYLLENAISKEGNPVFLRYGRWSGEKEWSLVGLEDIFADAENEQVERLLIEDGRTAEKPYIARAPSDYGSDVKNFMSGIASRIYEYKFSPMVAIDDNRIVNTPYHLYDWSRGQFNIYFKENLAKEVANKLTETGKKGLFSMPKGHVLLNINQTKQKGIMLNNAYSSKPFSPPETPRLNMMKDAIFLNEAISFVTAGLTIRSPGRFLFIDHSNSNDYNAFDDRFLGQWMMTKVVHIFTQSNYITEVIANKIDTFSKIWDVQENKL